MSRIDLGRAHTVQQDLVELEQNGPAPIVAEECASYRKILAILHLMKRPSKIRLFVKSGVCDSDLPLADASVSTGPSVFYGLRSEKSGSLVRFKKRADAKEFLERQWSVLVPFFHCSDGTHVPHHDFESEVILPFLSHEETAKEGGSGKVYKIEIHPDHHSFKKQKVSSMRSSKIVYRNANIGLDRSQLLCCQGLEVVRRKSVRSGSQSPAKA